MEEGFDLVIYQEIYIIRIYNGMDGVWSTWSLRGVGWEVGRLGRMI